MVHGAFVPLQLYGALVPLPIYALLGSSRHISVGPFALVSILVAETVSAVVQAQNRYIDVQAPWALKKTDPERMATVLWVLMESLRWVAIAYQPVIPSLASGILDQLNVPLDARHFGCLSPECALVAGGPLPKPERLSLSRESCRRAAAASPAKKDPPGVSKRRSVCSCHAADGSPSSVEPYVRSIASLPFSGRRRP